MKRKSGGEVGGSGAFLDASTVADEENFIRAKEIEDAKLVADQFLDFIVKRLQGRGVLDELLRNKQKNISDFVKKEHDGRLVSFYDPGSERQSSILSVTVGIYEIFVNTATEPVTGSGIDDFLFSDPRIFQKENIDEAFAFVGKLLESYEPGQRRIELKEN